MARSEYFRFLETLQSSNTTDSVRKLANLVAIHFDALSPLSTHQGQRIKNLVALAQKDWATIKPNTQIISTAQKDEAVDFSQLNRLAVGPFRGFGKQEEFDLNSRLVLVYGPNGTGKTSFCEALEYGLLGKVLEAESNRFREQNDYLKNAYVNRFLPPKIYRIDSEGNEVEIVSNEAAYRFCFVEKNRIDSFSRIAAQAPAKQTELISTLFGLDSFTDFVRNFSAEIGVQYIDVVGEKLTRLTQKELGLAGAHQQIQNNNKNLEVITAEESALAKQYRGNITFSQMVLELNGNDEISGAIERLEAELQQPIAAKSNLTSAALEKLRNSIVTTIQELRGKQQELTAASQQVSFKQLYEAVSQVQQGSLNNCPACLTPLNEVAIDPYIHANQELQKLQQLATIQQAAKSFEQSAKQNLFQLSQIINTCLNHFSLNNPLEQYQTLNNTQPEIQWWESLLIQLPDGYTSWEHLVSQVQKVQKNDVKIDQAIQQKSAKQAELNRLREYARQITALQTRRQTADKAITDAQQLIENFQIENAQLIAAVEAEKSVVERNKEIVSAYATFVQNLNNYNKNLPAQLVADLGEKVIELYNAFNRNDSASELLANVALPLTQSQRLKVAFHNDPDQLYDALQILSEGHVRCLGLAILLAKNLKENAPVLIFDDPVNAIDDEHRESIRRTLFEDQYFASKQIILTCHGEEFFKDIQNLLPAQAANQAKSFSFLPRLGEQHIRVDFNCAPRNYILAAREHINKNEVRQALAKSRQALEVLTKDKVWRYVSRYGDGNLSLKLRSVSASIELRNLTEQLKSKINKQDFSAPSKEAVFEPIEALLGLNGDSREWRYLNKGTHEESDRAEFDRYTVDSIVSALEKLDVALT